MSLVNFNVKREVFAIVNHSNCCSCVHKKDSLRGVAVLPSVAKLNVSIPAVLEKFSFLYKARSIRRTGLGRAGLSQKKTI